jgi:SAM-dependent methyltransferase
MLFNCPLSPEKANQIIRVLGVSPNDRVFDAGCGRGELLIRLIEASGADGLGIDSDAQAIADARTNAEGRIEDASTVFRHAVIKDVQLEDNSFDLAMCIGSTHAFGSGDAAYPNAIDALSRLVRPAGQVLIGEGYWKQPPAAEYLALIGEPVGIYHDHAGNIAFAEQRGLVPLYAVVSNDDEWDDFEWSHRMRIERHAALHPDEPGMAAKLKRSRAWRDGYLRWGRATMGFGFYLFTRQVASLT